jgi:hypothetical protein
VPPFHNFRPRNGKAQEWRDIRWFSFLTSLDEVDQLLSFLSVSLSENRTRDVTGSSDSAIGSSALLKEKNSQQLAALTMCVLICARRLPSAPLVTSLAI